MKSGKQDRAPPLQTNRSPLDGSPVGFFMGSVLQKCTIFSLFCIDKVLSLVYN